MFEFLTFRLSVAVSRLAHIKNDIILHIRTEEHENKEINLIKIQTSRVSMNFTFSSEFSFYLISRGENSSRAWRTTETDE